MFDPADLFSSCSNLHGRSGPVGGGRKVIDLTKGQKVGGREREGEGQSGLEASVIRIIAVFLVPVSSSPRLHHDFMFTSER